MPKPIIGIPAHWQNESAFEASKIAFEAIKDFKTNTLKCKTCDAIGAPVEGMTGQCPICGEIYCLGHLNTHDHTMNEVRFAELRVLGIGRVGSYAKAVQSHHSRNRKYWAIGYFDTRKEYERTFKESISYPHGNRICSDSPHFKTKTAAQIYLNNIKATPNNKER